MKLYSIQMLVVVFLLVFTSSTVAAVPAEFGRVEIIRDQWGVPNVFAESDAGAMYGLGYATAEDRAFQMTLSLRTIQGRLAETVGDIPHVRRNETAIDSDKKMRMFGFSRAADEVAAALDDETQALLEAYSDGVNDYFAAHRDDLHPLFAKYEVEPEPWTPADCLASWWHFAQFFATDGTRDLNAYRGLTGEGQQRREETMRQIRVREGLPPVSGLKPLPPDDAAAVVQQKDVDPAWIERVDQYARDHGLLTDADAEGSPGPKFSHAWVVGGRRSTTGSSVLVSDPQTPVRNPSLLYEFHIVGKSFNARGVGVAGSPVILIGFSDKVAWGMTALGADQADLFRLQTDAQHPNQYFFDGQWRDMEVRRETIAVRGGEPLEYTVRTTHFGPVSTEFSYARPNEGQVAVKRVPLCQTDGETIEGNLAMMRAADAREFSDALAGWSFPTANCVFGDRDGTIGYAAIGAIPVRSAEALQHGRAAHDGTASKYDWQGTIPHDLLPQVLAPDDGVLFSGNHRAIGSFYNLPIGAMTGSGGDTLRSWRLRQLLTTKETFTPEDVLAVHYDTVNPARSEIVRLGLHLRDVLERDLSEDALIALAVLEPWYNAGASSDLNAEGAALAMELSTFFRVIVTDLTEVYGGGGGGISYFLKTMHARLDENPRAEISSLEQEFIDQTLAGAWNTAFDKYWGDPEDWSATARQMVTRRPLAAFASLDGFGSLDPDADLKFAPITCVDGETIHCQAAQSYTQFVPMHDPDTARTILPIGQSERPGNRWRLSNYELWGAGKLHPAPLSRAAVEEIAAERVTLP